MIEKTLVGLDALHYVERDVVIFGKEIDWKNGKESLGGILRFSEMSLDTLKFLVEKEFACLDDTQNDAPSLGEFIEFLEECNNDNIKLHGYAVSPWRDDYRVTIEGMIFDYDPDTLNMDLHRKIVLFNRRAYKFDDKDGKLISWWD